ncbi:DUF434 domain-containing protein [Carboxylicivirga sediminis]|uniref:DUF434 domain-containing protein n=1 Tax=Carboxylicivirga sediminis TaxID=2006564 RepID=A0A941FAX8_9BACT|nr:DUF434 domain-containing protein [Carboxylicivirga sediminis]MBR8538084.1 DUF434 domain-containing protein [Carboxylicivirga sediminis]
MRNRGKQSGDDTCFAAKWHPVLKEAVNDYCYLLTREYAENSALQVVGNRYRLNQRQRSAIRRIGSGEETIKRRQHSHCSPASVKDSVVEVDGFNMLILLENALSGAFIFKARDGTYRDISSVHGSYKRVTKTEDAIILIGKALEELHVKSVKWYLDQPVSNSGRLKTRMMEIARQHQFNWEVELLMNPDKKLAQSECVVISSDGWILDRVNRWFNLGAYVIEKQIKEANVMVV